MLLDRVFKYIINQRNQYNVVSVASHKDPERKIQMYQIEEENIVRYMSGYVVVKLLKKYRKGSSSEELKKKWKSFERVLQSMKYEDQPECEDTIDDYSRAWSDHIDRGGLFHVQLEVSMG